MKNNCITNSIVGISLFFSLQKYIDETSFSSLVSSTGSIPRQVQCRKANIHFESWPLYSITEDWNRRTGALFDSGRDSSRSDSPMLGAIERKGGTGTARKADTTGRERERLHFLSFYVLLITLTVLTYK